MTAAAVAQNVPAGHEYRVFDRRLAETDPIQRRVLETYEHMHSKQTVQFVNDKIKQYGRFDHGEMSIMEAMKHLVGMIDESDPDVNVPNIVHAYQTAERIRAVYPDNEWLQFTGFIHDLGKVLVVFKEPQWCVAGDTFIVGCLPPKSVVYGPESFQNNPDMKDERYNTELGMYQPNCGLNNVLVSWGHDEYFYRVLKNHPECRLSAEALHIVRFHSLYPWHSDGEYEHLCNEHDQLMKQWVLEFNKFDLYTKTDSLPDIEALEPYYTRLAEKFCPGKIRF